MYVCNSGVKVRRLFGDGGKRSKGLKGMGNGENLKRHCFRRVKVRAASVGFCFSKVRVVQNVTARASRRHKGGICVSNSLGREKRRMMLRGRMTTTCMKDRGHV